MPVFVGPVEFTRSPVDADPAACARNPLGNRLMRFYGAQSRGVNLFIMRDGTVTRNDPTDWSLVTHALWGAHTEPITAAEAALLTAAGWGAYIFAGPDDWLTNPNGTIVQAYDATNNALRLEFVAGPATTTGNGLFDANSVMAFVLDAPNTAIRGVPV